MTTSEWTTTPPTEKGLYKAICSPDSDAGDGGDAVWAYFDVYFTVLCDDNLYGVDAFTHWFGPISEPEMPK